MGIESSTEHYTVGRGQVFFNKKKADGTYEGMRTLGNVKSLTTSVAVEKLKHYSTKSKYRKLDKSAVVEILPSVKLVLDEINAENYALFFMATITEVDQQAATAKTKAIADVKKGYIYDIGDNFLSSTGFSLEVASAAKTLGTDYLIDYRTGKVTILVGGTIADGDDIDITYDLLAKKFKKLNAFSEGEIEGELFYASDNAAGTNQQITLWSVNLAPSGETVLIAEGADWMNIEMEGEVQDDSNNHPLEPFGKVVIDA
jgi:hypothetical protein